MSRKPRRSFTAEQKAVLLRSHHVDKFDAAESCTEEMDAWFEFRDAAGLWTSREVPIGPWI